MSDGILDENRGRLAGWQRAGASAVNDSVLDGHEQITGSMLLDDG